MYKEFKRRIKASVMKHKGICVDYVSIYSVNAVSLKADTGSAYKAVMCNTWQFGQLVMGEGSVVDGARLYGDIELGRFANVNGPSTVLKCNADKIIIGDFSSVAMNCVLIDNNHLINRTTSYAIRHNIFGEDYMKDIERKGNIVLEEDVWIGANSVIVGGVTIGRGSVIGAGSVVTKDIPRYSIAFGTPAVVKKRRFSEETISLLEEASWWKWSIDEIKRRKDFFVCERN